MISPPPKWGFEKLLVDTQAYFNALSPSLGTVVAYGPRALAEQINQGTGRANRVIFLSGDPEGTEGGTLVSPREPGWREIDGYGQLGPADAAPDPADPKYPVTARTRTLADWDETLLVSVWAYDGNAPNSDLAQKRALNDLVEWTVRAIASSGLADIVWGPIRRPRTVERRFGLEVRFSLTLQTPLFDVPTDVAHPTPIVSGRFVHQ